jgi:hypothetical protein
MTIPVARTPEEIIAQIESATSWDLFEVDTTILLTALSYEDAKAYLKPEVTEDQWTQTTDLTEWAEDRIERSIDKAGNHRGISAGLAINHLLTLVWLSGTDKGYQDVEDAEYENYGAPKCKAAAEALGLSDFWESKADKFVRRMAEGEACYDGCDDGCGR